MDPCCILRVRLCVSVERFCSLLVCTGNHLSELPISVGQMSSLRNMDISENTIRELPQILARVRTLEVCVCLFVCLSKGVALFYY